MSRINGKEYFKKIGTLERTITLCVYQWGIAALVEDVTSKLKKYSMRRFKFTSKYVNYESLVKRNESYYKLK